MKRLTEEELVELTYSVHKAYRLIAAELLEDKRNITPYRYKLITALSVACGLCASAQQQPDNPKITPNFNFLTPEHKQLIEQLKLK